MKLHPYFEQVRWPQRPDIRLAWIEDVLRSPIRTETQPDGRVRYWGHVAEATKYLMKLFYNKETDALYIKLSDAPSVESSEPVPDIVLDFDAAGRLVGIDMDHASRHVDVTSLEASGLPLGTISAR